MPNSSNLADAADYIAAKPQLMKSYDDFGSGARAWFYSFNASLVGANLRPKKFAGWEDWHSFRKGQKFYLDVEAGFTRHEVAETPANLLKLQQAWKNWPTAYHVVQQGGGTDHHSSCNIFLGECLSLCGYGVQAAHGGKYNSAQSYWRNHNSFVQQMPHGKEHVKRGMIMSYFFAETGYYHLEVITSGASVGTKPIFMGFYNKDIDTFKSRGGGRSVGENGVEKIGGSDARDLADKNLKIFRLKN